MSTIRVTFLTVTVGLVALACSSSPSSDFVPSTGATGGTEPTAGGVQAALDQLVASGVPGGVVIVDTPDGETVFVSGSSDTASANSMTADTPFPLGGVTATYVATALLEMADEGLVDLGDSVEDHLPGLLDYGWDVAIFDLLQHIAGVPDHYAVGDPPGAIITACATTADCEWTAAETTDLIADLESDFQPGEGWGWSNSNARVAELIIPELTGSDWSEEVTARVLGPLGLDATSFPTDWSEVEGLAHGYSDIDGNGQAEDVTDLLPYGSGGNGAMTATPSDLVAFLRPLLEGTLLSEAADVALFAAAPTGFGSEEYGHGVFFPRGETAPISAVAGEALGYSIYVEHDRETDTTTAILLNQSGEIDPDLWGNLVTSATGRDDCDARERGTTVPGGLRLYCAEPAGEPGQSIQKTP